MPNNQLLLLQTLRRWIKSIEHSFASQAIVHQGKNASHVIEGASMRVRNEPVLKYRRIATRVEVYFGHRGRSKNRKNIKTNSSIDPYLIGFPSALGILEEIAVQVIEYCWGLN
jgi:hypothetical protein